MANWLILESQVTNMPWCPIHTQKLIFPLKDVLRFLQRNVNDDEYALTIRWNHQVSFGNFVYDLSKGSADQSYIYTSTILFSVIGCSVIAVGYVQVAFWMTAAERQSHRIRMNFFRNVLHQEIGWFDTHEVGELNTRLSE